MSTFVLRRQRKDTAQHFLVLHRPREADFLREEETFCFPVFQQVQNWLEWLDALARRKAMKWRAEDATA